MKTEPIRFDKMLSYRDQSEAVEMVRIAARQANVRPSVFVRSAIHMALQMAGFDTANIGGGE